MYQPNKIFFISLWILLLATVIIAIAFGAVKLAPVDMWLAIKHFFSGLPPQNIYEGVFLQLRLPRVLLCCIVGAILSASGVLMQGLFRNPIVEPGLVGTSAGAAFGASIVFVMAGSFSPQFKAITGPLLVPIFAFAGGMLATWAVYVLAKAKRRVGVTALLLVGIAINAVGLSGTGFMSYIARDPQARSITFWNLGTFSGAGWLQVYLTGSIAAIIFFISLRYAKQLNALILGDEEAAYLGVNTTRLKKRLMIYNTAMVAVATAFVGVISFVGLIVPHVLRLLIGSDNRSLLPASMIFGAILMCLTDLLARLLLAPAEIPVGIITSLVGAPVFIFLLKKHHVLNEGGGNYD
ncbi:MAG: iron ABC transporter permease [Ferruginibacter sp.]